MKKFIVTMVLAAFFATIAFGQQAKPVPKNAKLVFENSEVKIFKKKSSLGTTTYYGQDSQGNPVVVSVAKLKDSSNKNQTNKKNSGGEVTLPCSTTCCGTSTRGGCNCYIFHPCKN